MLNLTEGAQWLSGRVIDSRRRGCGLEPDQHHCVVSLSKTHLSLLSTGSIVGILTFISMINATFESLKARKVSVFQHFSFYEQLKYHA